MKNRILSIVLVLCMVCTLLPVTAFAATVVNSGTNGNITWSLDSDGILTISGSGAMNSYGNANYNDTSATSAPWGKYYSSIKSVVIENGVTSIGRYAFYGRSSLTSVNIGNSVTGIGNEAFYGCSSLTGIVIPDSVTNMGYQAFSNCSSLTSVVIPKRVTSIGGFAFSGCSSLESVTIESSVMSIESDDIFSGCSSLTSVTIGSGVTSIGNQAFYCCSSLTSVVIPDSVTIIGSNAFAWCSSLTSVVIPNSVTSIGGSAFAVCSSLTIVSIPNSVTSIGDATFIGCDSLKSVTIPDSVTSIGDATFIGCDSLKSVTIPDSVTSIGWYAFSECSSLTDIYFLGTQAEWEEILIDDFNDSLSNASIHFMDESSQISAPENAPTELSIIPVGADIPEGASVGVEAADEQAADIVIAELGEVRYAAFDISLTDAQGTELQPESGVLVVSIAVPEGFDAEKCDIYRVEEDGSLTDMNASVVNGKLQFATEHFSLYIITENAEPDSPDEPDEPDQPVKPLSFFRKIIEFFRSFFARIFALINR